MTKMLVVLVQSAFQIHRNLGKIRSPRATVASTAAFLYSNLYSRMSIWTSVDVFSQRANGPQTLSMCSLYHIAAMESHGDAHKAPWVAYGHAQSDSDDRLTANPGRLAVEPLQPFLQQKGCCRGLYSSHALCHGLISSTTSLQHSTVYSSTAVLQSTTSTPPLWWGVTPDFSPVGVTYAAH